MLQTDFQGSNFSYSYNKKTIEYCLTNMEKEISITIFGKDALYFQYHISVINKINTEMKNYLIEEAIDYFLNVNAFWSIEEKTKKQMKK